MSQFFFFLQKFDNFWSAKSNLIPAFNNLFVQIDWTFSKFTNKFVSKVTTKIQIVSLEKSLCFCHIDLILRLLWTLPGRKPRTMSSSFPSTITIPNFKPISLTVVEFWKRYHQTAKILKLRSNLNLVPYQVLLVS